MDIKDILDEMCGVGEDKDYIIDKIEELKKENKKLKKENKINKQVIKILNKKVEELKKEIDEYESVEQSLMKCVREGGGYDEMLPIHYRQESESDDEWNWFGIRKIIKTIKKIEQKMLRTNKKINI